MSGIEVHKANSSDETGWEMVVAGPVEFDLVKLMGVEEKLGEAPLDPGLYDQVRLNMDQVDVIIERENTDKFFVDRVVLQATVPSGKLRIAGGFTLEAGETTILTLDFDADRSVVFADTDNVLVEPVIKLLVRREGDSDND